MASPTRWTWVWVNSGRWWWTRRPGVLWFLGSQRVGHDLATELNWSKEHSITFTQYLSFLFPHFIPDVPRFPSCITSLLSEALPSDKFSKGILPEQVSWLWILLVFLHLKMSSFHLHSRRIFFTKNRILSWQSSPFSYWVHPGSFFFKFSYWFFSSRISIWLICLLDQLHVCVLVAQSCPTLCDPMNYSPPGSSVHGILQARILERVAIPFSRGSSWPMDRTFISCLLHWLAGSLSLVLPGKPIYSSIGGQMFPTFLYHKKYCNEHVSSYICVKICLARVALNGTDGS